MKAIEYYEQALQIESGFVLAQINLNNAQEELKEKSVGDKK